MKSRKRNGKIMDVTGARNYKFSLLTLFMGLLAAVAWYISLAIIRTVGSPWRNEGFALAMMHLTALLVLLFFMKYKDLRQVALGSYERKNDSPRLYFLGVGAVFGLYAGMEIFKWLNSVPSEPFMIGLASSPFFPVWIWMLFTILIVAPIGEELLFRGILLGIFKVNDGFVWRVTSVLVPAIIFMCIHTQYKNISSYFVIFLLALMLGTARIVSGGIKLPIIMHSVASALACIFDVLIPHVLMAVSE